MKITLLVVPLFCAVAALGQSSISGSPMAASFQVPQHPERASAQPIAQEQNLLGTGSLSSAHGEMPLWEAMPETKLVPLGDIARRLRKEHATAKKAHVVMEK